MTEPKPRYVNILSLDRSRSTITNIYLVERYGGIALGEVARTISPRGSERDFLRRGQPCSCGKPPISCEFWNDVIFDNDPRARYFRKISESGSTVFDSSKTIRHSKEIRRRLKNNNIMAICLLRDFEGWSTSVNKAQIRNGEGSLRQIFNNRYFILANVRLYLRRYRIPRYFEYIFTNIRLIREARAYPKSALVTDSSMLLDLDIEPSPASVHIVRGNRIGKKNNTYQHWSCTRDLSVKFLLLFDRWFF